METVSFSYALITYVVVGSIVAILTLPPAIRDTENGFYRAWVCRILGRTLLPALFAMTVAIWPMFLFQRLVVGFLDLKDIWWFTGDELEGHLGQGKSTSHPCDDLLDKR